VFAASQTQRAQILARDPHGAIQKQHGDDIFVLG